MWWLRLLEKYGLVPVAALFALAVPTVWGIGAAAGGTVLFAVDHHRGSEENQAGWEHHDPTVVDARTGRMDTLPFFRSTIHDAGLEDVVIAVVGQSPSVAAAMHTPVAFLFIDGGHRSEEHTSEFQSH